MTQFEEIYGEYFDDVYNYIYRLSGNRDIAEEITSETFFKALKAIDGFKGECEIRVWLCQIAKNSYYSFIKKQKRSADIDISDIESLPERNESLEEQVIKTDEANRIRSILHLIDEPYKEVFMWRVFADMSFKQIGEIFRKSDNWACVTFHRAKKMILDRMEENDNEK
ncbi:MAG: sigma-70 family RNA polymerase sigma factor [Clostridiales bacterium]|nr:sigma-70 family RNA polymerase sigma factor [Clostridiales bacterium]